MFIAETILVATLFANVPKRKRDECEVLYISDGNPASSRFQAVSGISLETTLTLDLQDINGVIDASVKRIGNHFEVSVVLDELEFSKFQKISNKELELFDLYPDLTFSFIVTPAPAMEYTTSAVNAA